MIMTSVRLKLLNYVQKKSPERLLWTLAFVAGAAYGLAYLIDIAGNLSISSLAKVLNPLAGFILLVGLLQYIVRDINRE
ncbi:hypothetical protein [Pseudidiomarina insulisalsae]|uniref:Uncharacterized protein n=1 Tax=Pseudidiomarina insulisalsae TaxID=575789 RepID=A0A432YLD1_9GAMM|nr:hypothetical protein [Pseudidiomarina insulisalsae]RUO61787.1 hypothetical protein CWI71_05345 [Pseudidiomarina insulisalsae]